MQSVLSRNWTQITVSIYCDDNYYTTGTSTFIINLFINNSSSAHLFGFKELILPVGCRCRIHRLFFCWGVRTPIPNECPEYDTTQSDRELPIRLDLWGMLNIPSLPSVPGPLKPEVVAPGRVLSMGQIELNCVLMQNWITSCRTVLTCKRYLP